MEDNLIWHSGGDNAPVLVLAHGAGAGMDSDFMLAISGLLGEQGVTTVRFEFPYMHQRRLTGKKRPPDRLPRLLAHWQQVLAQVQASTCAPVFIGGKSMGGRIASMLAAQSASAQMPAGVVCLGYPFYARGKDAQPRIDHLQGLAMPLLIVQGTRDAMGSLPAVSGYALGMSVRIHWLADGDHDLRPRKSSGLTHEQHLQETARVVSGFIYHGRVGVGDKSPADCTQGGGAA